MNRPFGISDLLRFQFHHFIPLLSVRVLHSKLLSAWYIIFFFCCCLLRKIHNTNGIIQLMIIRETAYQISFSLGLAVAKIFGSNSKGNNKANKMAELSWKRRQTTKTAAKQQSAKKV